VSDVRDCFVAIPIQSQLSNLSLDNSLD